MAALNLNERSYLTEEQKEMATTLLTNEINDTMVSIDIITEELEKTSMFRELDLRVIAADYINKRLRCNPDGSYDEELLQYVYSWYFPKKRGL